MKYLKAIFALALVGSISSAQSGSANYIVLSQDIVATGGSASSPSYQAEQSVSPVVAGEEQNSPSFSSQNGIPSVEPVLGTDQPIVFGVQPAYGSKNGGEAVTLFGANFTAAGAGPTDVDFSGFFGSNVVVQSSTTITLDSPIGSDAFGNPLGRVGARVTNALGTSLAQDAFGYTPVLELEGVARVGGAPFKVRLVSGPPVFYFLSLGFADPNAFLPVSPFEGSMAILSFSKTIKNFAFSPGATAITLAVPDDPSLAGFTVDFQALAIDNPVELSGSFSNVLPIPIMF